MIYYAGIGSRETPEEICRKIRKLAAYFSGKNFCLNSGGASGADAAFEETAVTKQIFLPWDGFNGRKANGVSYIVPPLNLDLVQKYHPRPSSLSSGGLKLMSRNSYQVLGKDLNTPVKFVVCWTKNGTENGGTAQAMRIARSQNIPIFNLFDREAFEKLGEYVMGIA